MIRQNT